MPRAVTQSDIEAAPNRAARRDFRAQAWAASVLPGTGFVHDGVRIKVRHAEFIPTRPGRASCARFYIDAWDAETGAALAVEDHYSFTNPPVFVPDEFLTQTITVTLPGGRSITRRVPLMRFAPGEMVRRKLVSTIKRTLR